MINIGALMQTVDTPRDPLEEFIKRYRIYKCHSDRVGRDFVNSRAPSGQQMVSIVMAEQSLDELVRGDQLAYQIMEADALEKSVRNRCPAVKKAWEQYRMLLEISK